jgi:hypothetical protein
MSMLHALRSSLVEWTITPFRQLYSYEGEQWNIVLTGKLAQFGASLEAEPVGYRHCVRLHITIGVPGLELSLTRLSSYDLWERACLKDCRCCRCCRQVPCGGVEQGAFCDRELCRHDDPAYDPDEDNIPF